MFVWHNTVLLCRYGICMKGLFFMLLNAALKEYLLECELRNYTEKTIKGYRNSIELLVNYLQQTCSVQAENRVISTVCTRRSVHGLSICKRKNTFQLIRWIKSAGRKKKKSLSKPLRLPKYKLCWTPIQRKNTWMFAIRLSLQSHAVRCRQRTLSYLWQRT